MNFQIPWVQKQQQQKEKKNEKMKSTWNYSGNLSLGGGDAHVEMHRKQLKSNNPDGKAAMGDVRQGKMGSIIQSMASVR